MTELVPGLVDYLTPQGGTPPWEGSMMATALVSFREFGHDTIELSLVYKRTDGHRTMHLGFGVSEAG